jgi:hypothetical protein
MNPTNKSSLPIIIATAAVTVAVGLTAATLGGYVGPKTVPLPEPSASQPEAVPRVSEPEPVFASNRSHEEHERHEHAKRHHEDER